MARPLVEAEEVTGRIASGELASRVPVRPNDYPEFASLAGSINDMAQSLEDSRARERHLLLAVSHDLRTPLTSIRGFAEAIQDGAIEDSSQAADVIIAEARRLERLVGDLLDLTKLEARQMSISMRPTDAAEIASTTAEGFRPAAAKNGLADSNFGWAMRRTVVGRSHPLWPRTRTAWRSCWPISLRTPSPMPRPSVTVGVTNSS